MGNSAGLDANLIFGATLDSVSGDLALDLALQNKMANAYNTDLYVYLNKSVNRTETLQLYISEFDQMVKDAETRVVILNEEMNLLQNLYESLSSQKVEVENAYFDLIDNEKSQQAAINYEKFIDLSNQIVEVQAQYNTKNYIVSRYNRFLDAIKPRIVDVKANFDALVKGVKVFDVQNSDIQAIISL